MILKSIKYIALTGVGLGLVGGAVFGTDLLSYAKSSARSVQSAVKDNVPIEFEIRRARDLLNDIIPEMHANIRLIAQQEVELSNLKADILQSQKNLREEQARVQKLRDCLSTTEVSYNVGGINYSRDHMKDELSRRFDHYKEAEVVMAGKQRLLENREKALLAGMAALDRTRSQKCLLENQVESLEGQFRLIRAASVGTKLNVDNSKLAQTEKLLSQIKKQLDVAERVLSHEARFTDAIPVDVVNEKDLVSSVDEHFAGAKKPSLAQSDETRPLTLK